jgi:hypothetical protein
MTLTADSEGRIASRELFPPHTSFEAVRQSDGKVMLTRVERESVKPRLVSPVERNGLLVIPINHAELDTDALDRQIREERDRENAGLLG